MLARPQLRRTIVPVCVVVILCLFPAAAAALTVTKTADTNDGTCDADCSLREAIADTPAGGVVSIPASATPYEVTDALGSLVIEKDLTIAGAGARSTEVTAPGPIVRVFTVRGAGIDSVEVTIRDLAITEGDGGGGGYGAQGGGVLLAKDAGLVGPVLTLQRVRVAGNRASVSGGSSQAVGGGINATGAGAHLIVKESSVVGNQSIGTAGGEATAGGIGTFVSAHATIENTTIAGNESIGQSDTNAAGRAGGMLALKGSLLVNVTIFGNSTSRTDPLAAPSISGNFEASLAGIGDPVALRNTIVAGGKAETLATADCSGSATSEGGNVLGTGCTLGTGDVFTNEPLLGPLADNGGETDTMALLSGSPALEHGVACPPPANDQRGVPRPQGGSCDSGAFELERPQVPAGGGPKPGTAAYRCQGRLATMVGGNGRDVIVGTAGRDVIVARGGNDQIKARAGSDLVCGGPGRDLLVGGAGRDRLYGQRGADVIRGGPGKDKLLGGQGKDRQVQ